MARRRRWIVLAALAAFVLVATTAWALITPVKVVVEPAWQWYPFGNATYIAYTSNSEAAPKRDDAIAIARVDGSRVARMNEVGTEGYTGGFDPGTDTVIYQQVTRAGESDLYFYDLATKTRASVPVVNTGLWEWAPRISSSYVFFFRNYRSSGVWYVGMHAWDRVAAKAIRIGSYRWADGVNLLPGMVGDRYATWAWCNPVCNAYLYDLERSRLRKIPSVEGRAQSSPVVDEANGLVFFVRAGLKCGRGTTFLSLPLSDLRATPTKIAALPEGIQAWNGSLMPSEDGKANDLLFTRVPCSGTSDLYALPGVSLLGA